MISIIVPVYNIENYIETCIRSVLEQTYKNWELLLINDGSTDSSLKICSDLAKKDSRIHVHTKENGGVSSARNLGLDLAAGEYIFFLDGDDRIRCDCLEKLLEFMSADVDLVFSDYMEIHDEGFHSDLVLQHKNYEGILSKTEAIEDLYKAQIYPRVIWGKLYRKKAWEHLRFNHMAYSEDTFAMFEILQQTDRLYSIHEPLYYYLQRASSASRQKKTSEYEDHTETLLYLYRRALSDYPAVRSYPAEEYIGVAYGLLKNYQKEHRKQEALKLIEDMQFVYRTSALENPAFSRKALQLPKHLFYLLIYLKELISRARS